MKNSKLTRTCIGCGTKRNKKELIRIVCNNQKEIKVDFEQKLEGRGTYICNNQACFDKMEKKNKLKYALKTNISNGKYDELRGVMFGRTI